ncbi:MAG: hypothetical protein SFX73_05685 [Kofleriaceae bacterium]|nr:hypothetical protein [Kofleriaceae bacterium]
MSLYALRVRHAWRASQIAAVINTGGMLLNIGIGRAVHDLPWWPSALSAIVGALLFGALHAFRARPTLRFASAAFLINTAAITTTLWVMAGYFRSTGEPLTAFQAHKLGALLVALIGPELVPGILSILAYIVTAQIKVALLGAGERASVSAGELWILSTVGLISIVLLVYRLQGLANERRMVRAQTEAAALDRFAHVALALRDLSNTPLQTLELGVSLLRARAPDLTPELDRLDRSLEQLRQLNGVLARYESDLRWSPGDDALDSEAVVRRAEAQRRAFARGAPRP